MKTILGQKITKFQFYKMEVFKIGKMIEETKGFIWLENGTSIRVEGSKFYIYLTDRKKVGFISKGMKAYKKIKRIVLRWFQNYRKNGTFNNGVDYLRDSVKTSINKIKVQRLEKFKSQLV